MYKERFDTISNPPYPRDLSVQIGHIAKSSQVLLERVPAQAETEAIPHYRRQYPQPIAEMLDHLDLCIGLDAGHMYE